MKIFGSLGFWCKSIDNKVTKKPKTQENEVDGNYGGDVGGVKGTCIKVVFDVWEGVS